LEGCGVPPIILNLENYVDISNFIRTVGTADGMVSRQYEDTLVASGHMCGVYIVASY
jgi:hypothetical protein